MSNKTFFRQIFFNYKFRFYTIGTDSGCFKIFFSVFQGITVAADVNMHFSFEYFGLATVHKFKKTDKFAIISAPRDIEHILLRYEAEGVDSVRLLLRNDRKSYRHQPQKQGKKSDFSAHAFIYFTNSQYFGKFLPKD